MFTFVWEFNVIFVGLLKIDYWENYPKKDLRRPLIKKWATRFFLLQIETYDDVVVTFTHKSPPKPHFPLLPFFPSIVFPISLSGFLSSFLKRSLRWFQRSFSNLLNCSIKIRLVHQAEVFFLSLFFFWIAKWWLTRVSSSSFHFLHILKWLIFMHYTCFLHLINP